MFSILCLGNGPLTNTMHLSLPATNVCTSMAIPKLHLSHGRRRAAFVPVICSSEGSSIPSRNAESNAYGGKIWREMTGASLVLACAVGFFNAMNRKAIACSPQGPPAGKVAMGSLMEVVTTLSSGGEWFPTHRAEYVKDPINIHKIKKHAIRLVQRGKAGEAEAFLQRQCNFFPQTAFELEMALVEILICQGRYKEALNCRCLSDAEDVRTTEARIPLYKFIIHTMLDHKEEASKYWEKYGTVRDFPTNPPEAEHSDEGNST